jgi:hypothetical protein
MRGLKDDVLSKELRVGRIVRVLVVTYVSSSSVILCTSGCGLFNNGVAGVAWQVLCLGCALDGGGGGGGG